VSDEQRHHLNDYAQRYRQAAAAGSWDSAKHAAILLRRYGCDTDAQYADALYAEGFARERLGDVRRAAACYDLADRLGHPKAARRLQESLRMAPDTQRDMIVP
jgi:hypothetical protein